LHKVLVCFYSAPIRLKTISAVEYQSRHRIPSRISRTTIAARHWLEIDSVWPDPLCVARRSTGLELFLPNAPPRLVRVSYEGKDRPGRRLIPPPCSPGCESTRLPDGRCSRLLHPADVAPSRPNLLSRARSTHSLFLLVRSRRDVPLRPVPFYRSSLDARPFS